MWLNGVNSLRVFSFLNSHPQCGKFDLLEWQSPNRELQ